MHRAVQVQWDRLDRVPVAVQIVGIGGQGRVVSRIDPRTTRLQPIVAASRVDEWNPLTNKIVSAQCGQRTNDVGSTPFWVTMVLQSVAVELSR